MGTNTIQSNIQRLQQELANLQKKLSSEGEKIATKSARVSQARTGITNKTPPGIARMRLNEITRLEKEIVDCQKKQASIQKTIADKTTKLHTEQANLRKEEEKERKKNAQIETQYRKTQQKQQDELTRELAQQRELVTPLVSPPTFPTVRTRDVHYDAFICHASEDKDEFVRPLAQELQELGLKVWYDEFTLKVGDNLRRSIDNGLAKARFGVVVFSKAFFSKEWPQYELDGLAMREMDGIKVILPIWHRITKDEVMKYSPSMVNKLALNSFSSSVPEIAQQLVEVIQDNNSIVK